MKTAARVPGASKALGTQPPRGLSRLFSLLLQSNPRRRPVKGTLRALCLAADDRAFAGRESYCPPVEGEARCQAAPASGASPCALRSLGPLTGCTPEG